MDSPDSQSNAAGCRGVRRHGPADLCLRCRTGSKGCSQLPDGLIRCRGHVPPGLTPGQVVNGLVYLGPATGDPQWSLFRAARGGGRPARRHQPRKQRTAGDKDSAEVPPPTVLTLTEEDASLRDRVYRRLVAEMTLSPKHRKALLVGRQLTKEEVKRRSYKSLPQFRDRCNLARALREEFGEDAFRVPGVRLFDSKRKPGTKYPGLYPGTKQMTGLVIPVFDRHGRMVSLRIRVDQPEAQNKYRWWRFRDDARPGVFVHFGFPWDPAREPDRPVPEARITEGELKAGIAALRTGVLTLSLAGVGCWQRARPELEYLKTRGLHTVLVALDQDPVPNPAVYGAAMNLYDLAAGLGLRVEVETWGAAHVV